MGSTLCLELAAMKIYAFPSQRHLSKLQPSKNALSSVERSQYNLSFPGWIHGNFMTLSSNPILQIVSLFIKGYKVEFELKEFVNFPEVIWGSWHLCVFVLSIFY